MSDEIEPPTPTHPLRRAIDSFLRTHGMDDIGTLTRVIDAWPNAVGPAIAGHVRPVAFEDGVLFVEVDQPAWATEVAFISETAVERLAVILGTAAVRSLKARVRGSSGVQ